MALADITSWDALAAETGWSRSTLKDLGTSRGRIEQRHLDGVARATGLPLAWFEIADLGRAVARDDEGPSRDERLEAVERQVAALIAQLSQRPDPPAPPDELLGR